MGFGKHHLDFSDSSKTQAKNKQTDACLKALSTKDSKTSPQTKGTGAALSYIPVTGWERPRRVVWAVRRDPKRGFANEWMKSKEEEEEEENYTAGCQPRQG